MLKANLILTTLAAMLLAGCAGAPDGQPDEFFSDGQADLLHRGLDAQAAAAAVADPTLYATHFTNGALNSLGKAKVDLIVAGDEPLPLAVRIDGVDESARQAKAESVRTYLRSVGLKDEQFVVGGPVGELDQITFNAADSIKGLPKTDTGDAGASTGPQADTEPASDEAAAVGDLMGAVTK